MVIYDGCHEEYEDVVDQIFSAIKPEQVVWISLGTFRFIPALKSIIQKRFPDTKLVYGEFITGLDGKMRYFKPLRIQLYRRIVSRIRQTAPSVFVYFCMEDDEVWQNCFGYLPSDFGGLAKMLDKRAAEICGLR